MSTTSGNAPPMYVFP